MPSTLDQMICFVGDSDDIVRHGIEEKAGQLDIWGVDPPRFVIAVAGALQYPFRSMDICDDGIQLPLPGAMPSEYISPYKALFDCSVSTNGSARSEHLSSRA